MQRAFIFGYHYDNDDWIFMKFNKYECCGTIEEFSFDFNEKLKLRTSGFHETLKCKITTSGWIVYLSCVFKDNLNETSCQCTFVRTECKGMSDCSTVAAKI